MAVGECPDPSPQCPWYNRPTPPQLRGTQEHGCFSDEDHIFPKSLGNTALLKLYIQLPENKQQVCRWWHDYKTAQEQIEPPTPPTREFALEALARAIDAGQITLSVTKQRKILGKT